MDMTKIIKAIREKKSFLISTHINPDPDGLCAELALMMFLRSLGKKVVVLNNEKVPDRYHFFPKVNSMRSFKEGMRVNYDCAVILDCGDLKRIGHVREVLKDDKVMINIDHHITNELFGDYNLVDPNACSTTEVIYEFLKKAGCKVTKDIALCLYIGIMTDTGSFRYDNTTAKSHKAAGELLSYGISVTDVYKRLYDTIPLDDIKMFAKVVGDFDTHFKGKVVSVELRKKVSEKISEEFDLRDAIFKFLRSIKDIGVLVIFTENKKDRTKVNFRSAGNFNVAKIASLFGGGGHKKASGCILNYGMKDAKKKVLAEVGKVVKFR